MTLDFSAIKEKLNTSPRSDSKESTPLSVFLHIYMNATNEYGCRICYLNYMEGAKILRDWLYPIDLEVNTLNKLPLLFRTYEIIELAKIIHPQNPQFAEDAIYHEHLRYVR